MNFIFRVKKPLTPSEGDPVSRYEYVEVEVPVRPATAGARKQVRKVFDLYRREVNAIRKDYPEVSKVAEDRLRVLTERRRAEERAALAEASVEEVAQVADAALGEEMLEIPTADLSADFAEKAMDFRVRIEDASVYQTLRLAQALADRDKVVDADLLAGLESDVADSEFWDDQILEALVEPVERFCTAYKLS